MEDGLLENLLPKWVVYRIKEWIMKKKSGELKLIFSDGGIRSVKKTDVEYPPKK